MRAVVVVGFICPSILLIPVLFIPVGDVFVGFICISVFSARVIAISLT